ncbi:Ig-like domain-containing protein [Marinifilum sp. RC60d5]|uniref:Ig-like domain-containing protein n=1 Tax=Marinifilum sp. RC60d5 TaxID=3458414 RepID=UPI00403687A4
MIKLLHSKSLLILYALLSLSSLAFAQTSTEEYYQSATGKTGNELKTALHNIIKGNTVLPYTSSEYDVWDALKETDEDPNDETKIILIYTGRSEDKSHQDNGSGDNDSWNREHIWAKSHGDFGTDPGAGTDIHHLRACDRSVNSSRSNLFFDNGGEAHSEATECNYDSDSWEPRDAVKGDIARMIFYMAVRYEGEGDEPELEMTDDMSYSKDNYTEPFFGKLSTLKEWNLEDPVDDAELTRNEKVYEIQGNRNPFINHPEWIEEIWTTVVDVDSPEITAVSPANGEENVSSTTDLTITFNEDIDAGTGNITIYKYDDETLVESISTNSNQITYTSHIVDIELNSELENGVKYYVLIDNAAIIDASSNTFEGISNKDTWTFTTYIDSESPAIANLSPENGETNISLSANLVITFNENIQAGTGNIIIKNFETDEVFENISASDDQLTFSNKKVTIDPLNDFAEGTRYYVVIDNGTITDASSNTFEGISDKSSWNFTTIYTAPNLISISPEDNSNNISIETDLELTFDKEIEAGNGNLTIYNIYDDEIESIAASEAFYNGEKVSFDIAESLEGSSEYYILIDNDAFVSTNGIEFAGISSDTDWNFTTEVITGIDDLYADGVPSFYPNPATTEIKLTNMDKVVSIHITNLTGRNIMEVKSPDTRISLNNLAKGMYFITFVSSDGSRITKKLLKR